MNDRPICILMVGRDPSLLQTRRWILEARGYRIITSTRPSDLHLIPLYPPVELLILCHSLDRETCLQFIELAKAHWPGIKHLAVETTILTPCELVADRTVLALDGPLKLVSLVDGLVGEASAGVHVH